MNINISNLLNVTGKLIRYNFRIIFAGRFIWFVLAALTFFLFIAVYSIMKDNTSPDEEFLYNCMMFPAVLLIFYPMTFGVQNDVDAGVLEILFGIPDYRYKVWLLRLLMVFLLIFIMLACLTALGSLLLIPTNILEMTGHVIFPVFFIGNMAFMFSTIVRNGNGTAVVMVIALIICFAISGNMSQSRFDVFLNPYKVPNNMNEIIWQGVVSNNRLMLITGGITFILVGLLNLQKREKFI
ncbi:MAG: hypothetical protein LBR06_02645 [Bacteroidales bacterium]|jgi:hypothetical protein|nr:hypothetical protein [Bacteroidales bacterium]